MGDEVTPQEWRIRMELRKAMWTYLVAFWTGLGALASLLTEWGPIAGVPFLLPLALCAYRADKCGVPPLPARPEPEREWS